MSTLEEPQLAPRVPRLTPTEKRVLCVISEGHTSKEAALKLNVCKRTVDFHLANIYEKLQVGNRIRAIRVAASYGLLSDLGS